MKTVAGRDIQNKKSFGYYRIVDKLNRPSPTPYPTDRRQLHATDQHACRIAVVAVYIQSITVLIV